MLLIVLFSISSCFVCLCTFVCFVFSCCELIVYGFFLVLAVVLIWLLSLHFVFCYLRLLCLWCLFVEFCICLFICVLVTDYVCVFMLLLWFVVSCVFWIATWLLWAYCLIVCFALVWKADVLRSGGHCFGFVC